MSCRATVFRFLFLFLMVGLALTATRPAAAVEGAQGGSGFLLQTPKGSIGVRGGWSFPRAESDLFDLTIDRLTVDRSDFDAPTIGLELARRLGSRLDLVLGAEYGRSLIDSEFRDFVDQDGFAIRQETELTQLPVTASLRYYLASRGHQVGSYAWIPKPVVPYVGAGVGAVRYSFEQAGDFVDFVDLAIFADQFQSEGWSATVHAFAGVDVKLTARVRLALEGRYSWADSSLDGDFVGFDPIDLRGLRTLMSVNFLY